MTYHRYRHTCNVCGRGRSKTFHRRFPAGPEHPPVKGICRRCRLDGELTHIHIHHHHWYITGALEGYQSQTTRDAEKFRTSFNETPLTTLDDARSRKDAENRLSRSSELPAAPPSYQTPDKFLYRVELAGNSVYRPQELVANPAIPRSPSPPLVGAKPQFQPSFQQLEIKH
ncbi:hypothetical protein LZ30DRAFT_689874 [Colletotrichum cereale]|nr:hypothetical protein LZ30DRAFT_689874 [Colletotrichum cereale]